MNKRHQTATLTILALIWPIIITAAYHTLVIRPLTAGPAAILTRGTNVVRTADDITDLAATGFSSMDLARWNGSIFTPTTGLDVDTSANITTTGDISTTRLIIDDGTDQIDLDGSTIEFKRTNSTSYLWASSAGASTSVEFTIGGTYPYSNRKFIVRPDGVALGTIDGTAMANNRLTVRGKTSNDTTFSIETQDSSGNDLVSFRSDGNNGFGTASPNTTLAVSGTLGIGNPTVPTTGTNLAVFAHVSITPTLAANSAALFARDVSGTTEMVAIDEAGNEAQLTPHAFELFEPDPNEPYPWSYYACNQFLGTCINVDMAGVVRAVETLTGQQFIYYKDTPTANWYTTSTETQRARWIARKATQEIHVPTKKALITEPISETVTIGTAYTTTYTLADDGAVIATTTAYSLTELQPTGELRYILAPRVRLDPATGRFYRRHTLPEAAALAANQHFPPRQPPAWLDERLPPYHGPPE